MSKKLQLGTRDELFSGILSNGRQYVVPRFQRDYSWDIEYWENLWEDIERLLEAPEELHYMGYLVLQRVLGEMQRYKIIDGQQRLTTFSLLVLAAIKRLEHMTSEEERIENLRQSFIGNRDLVNLVFENKLELNRNNDYYYRRAIEGEEIPNSNVKKSVRLMRRALDYFYDRLGTYETSEEIGKLLQVVSFQTLFTIIYIGDTLNAYKVFETLNARGVQLSSADLLKNYLFALIDPNGDMPDEVLDEQDRKWEKIGANISNKTYTDYILTEWNSRHKYVRQTDLFKQVTTEVQDRRQAYDYLNSLAKNSQLYSALWNADDEFWKGHPSYKDIRKDLYCLSLFNIKVPYSLLMASHINFPNDFFQILRWVKIFSLRYNVICEEHPGNQERLYSEICYGTHNDSWGKAEVKNKLLELNPSESQFEQSFVGKIISTGHSNKRARYLLARIAEHQSKGESIDESDLTVEHILPLNADEHWTDYFGERWSSYNERLGNMVLVPRALNERLAQKPFGEKQEILLSESNYSKEIGDYPEWDSGSIESRQKKLAKIAAAMWRID